MFVVVWQVLSVADLCSAYLFLAKYNLKKRNLEAAEMYAHKCCEFNEVGGSVSSQRLCSLPMYRFGNTVNTAWLPAILVLHRVSRRCSGERVGPSPPDQEIGRSVV